jgi:hypothetical protein
MVQTAPRPPLSARQDNFISWHPLVLLFSKRVFLEAFKAGSGWNLTRCNTLNESMNCRGTVWIFSKRFPWTRAFSWKFAKSEEWWLAASSFHIFNKKRGVDHSSCANSSLFSCDRRKKRSGFFRKKKTLVSQYIYPGSSSDLRRQWIPRLWGKCLALHPIPQFIMIDIIINFQVQIEAFIYKLCCRLVDHRIGIYSITKFYRRFAFSNEQRILFSVFTSRVYGHNMLPFMNSDATCSNEIYVLGFWWTVHSYHDI